MRIFILSMDACALSLIVFVSNGISYIFLDASYNDITNFFFVIITTDNNFFKFITWNIDHPT